MNRDILVDLEVGRLDYVLVLCVPNKYNEGLERMYPEAALKHKASLGVIGTYTTSNGIISAITNVADTKGTYLSLEALQKVCKRIYKEYPDSVIGLKVSGMQNYWGALSSTPQKSIKNLRIYRG